MKIEINDGIVTIDDGGWGFGDSYRFKNDRGEIAANRPDFVWETHKGKFLYPRDMATPHLINAVNMIWRNVFKRPNDHPEIYCYWTIGYIQRALKELTNELTERVWTC